MNVRLIKSGMSIPAEKSSEPDVEVPIIETLQSWVRDFHSMKAKRTQMDFERINRQQNT